MATFTAKYTGEAINNAVGKASCLVYAECTNGTVSAAGYEFQPGVPVSIKFTYNVPANATLNINGKGAKSIYFNGAAIGNGIILANSTVSLVYTGADKGDRFELVSGGPTARVDSTTLILG